MPSRSRAPPTAWQAKWPRSSDSRSTLFFRLSPPRLRRSSRASATGGFAVSPTSSGRHDLLSVSIISMIEHHLLHSSTDDSKPGPGRRTHLTHGPLTGKPGAYFGRPLQPCLPVILHLDQFDYSPVSEPESLTESRLRSDSLSVVRALELPLLKQLCSCRHLAGLQVLPQRHQ